MAPALPACNSAHPGGLNPSTAFDLTMAQGSRASNPLPEAGRPPDSAAAAAASSATPKPEQPDSALLVKSMEAFRFSVHAYVPPGREEPGEASSMAAGSQAQLGIAGAGLRCSWRAGTRTLVLAGKARLPARLSLIACCSCSFGHLAELAALP